MLNLTKLALQNSWTTFKKARRRLLRLSFMWRGIQQYIQLQRNIYTIARAGLLDATWYLQQYPDVAQHQINPIIHYLRHGAYEGRNPNPVFDSDWYLQQYPDVMHTGVNPLVHYICFGAYEGRDPNPLFDSDWYLQQNPEVARKHHNPLVHYLQVGASKERDPNPHFKTQYFLYFYGIEGEISTPPLVDFIEKFGMSIEKQQWFFSQHPNIALDDYSVLDLKRIEQNILTYVTQKKNRNSLAVYTAIVDDYDSLKIPETPSPEIDYYCFSNTQLPTYGIYKILPIDYFAKDATRTARFIKTHPHYYFQDYDVVIWIDASILVQTDLMQFINRFLESGMVVGAIKHFERNSIYEEADTCIVTRKDEPSVIQQQIDHYDSIKFQQTTPLLETGFLMLRVNEKQTQDFLECWWHEIDTYSKRDQLSVNYALEKNGIHPHLIFWEGYSVRNYPGFLLANH